MISRLLAVVEGFCMTEVTRCILHPNAADW